MLIFGRFSNTTYRRYSHPYILTDNTGNIYIGRKTTSPYPGKDDTHGKLRKQVIRYG